MARCRSESPTLTHDAHSVQRMDWTGCSDTTAWRRRAGLDAILKNSSFQLHWYEEGPLQAAYGAEEGQVGWLRWGSKSNDRWNDGGTGSRERRDRDARRRKARRHTPIYASRTHSAWTGQEDRQKQKDKQKKNDAESRGV
jgi:hypothetical protein